MQKRYLIDMNVSTEVPMQKEKMIKSLAWAGIFVLALSFCVQADQKKDIRTDAIKVKPDLRIVGIKVERVGFTAAGAHQVKVKVTVINSAPAAVCAGPFQVKLEKRTPGGFTIYLSQQRVARLCVNPSLAKQATATLEFFDTIPVGQQRQWRATADSSGLVSEASENNNQGDSEIYVAKTFCAGVDLVVTKAEIVRGPHGVFIKVYGRNRCIGTCAVDVEAVFDVAVPASAAGAVTQRVGTASVGLLEYESGMIGVYSSSDQAVTYRVGIDFDGAGCTDTNPANNYCQVTLRPGEDRKTVNCH
jgi:hypothetical protein